MPVTVDGVRLWNASELTAATEARLNVTTPPDYEPGDALIVGLQSEGSVTVGGLATGIRISSQSGTPGDPQDALSEWLLKFESLCAANQGGGWSIVDDERDRTISGAVTELSWTYNEGAPFQARWSLTARRGEGLSGSAARSAPTATPQTTTTYGSVDLGGIVEKRVERSIDIESIPIAYADESETIVVPQSGVVRRFTINGRLAGSYSNLRTRDDQLRTYTGQDTTQTYQTGVPGSAYDARIDTYDSTVNAGSPAVWDYSLSLLEGVTL
jgi:hypothetical protein